MSVHLKNIIKNLQEFTRKGHEHLEIIILGGIAMEYYGEKNRKTIDLDAEVKGNIEKLLLFLKKKKIPADIGEDIARWGIVSLPPNYRGKAVSIYKDDALIIKVLHPLHFVIAKLRRATETDEQDALFVARKYKLQKKELKLAAQLAIQNSPKDTALFVFERAVEHFLNIL